MSLFSTCILVLLNFPFRKSLIEISVTSNFLVIANYLFFKPSI